MDDESDDEDMIIKKDTFDGLDLILDDDDIVSPFPKSHEPKKGQLYTQLQSLMMIELHQNLHFMQLSVGCVFLFVWMCLHESCLVSEITLTLNRTKRYRLSLVLLDL